MRTGDEWEVVLTPEMAFGEKGRGKLEGNMVVKFDLVLVEVLPEVPWYYDVSAGVRTYPAARVVHWPYPAAHTYPHCCSCGALTHAAQGCALVLVRTVSSCCGIAQPTPLPPLPLLNGQCAAKILFLCFRAACLDV